MSDAAALAAFYTEQAAHEAAYDDALAKKFSDPEYYSKVMTEIAEWRRDIKILAGRPGAAKALAVKEGRDLEWIDGRPEGAAENATVVTKGKGS